MKILKTVLKSLFKRAFTRRFSKVKPELPLGFRGKHFYDKEKCIGCQSCVRNCPAEAIRFIPKTKKVKYDLAKCIFCGMCEEVCPVKCIKLSREMILGRSDKKLIVK